MFYVNPQALGNFTVGLALNEITRQLQTIYGVNSIHKHFSFKNVVGLKMKNGTELIDYWLSLHNRPMPPIQDEDELEIIYSGRFESSYISRLCSI